MFMQRLARNVVVAVNESSRYPFSNGGIRVRGVAECLAIAFNG